VGNVQSRTSLTNSSPEFSDQGAIIDCSGSGRCLARVFLVLSFISGIILVFLIPPFQSPDEPEHFFRVFQISEGHITSEVRPQDRGPNALVVAGGMMPQIFVDQNTQFYRLAFDPSVKTSWNEITAQVRAPGDINKRVFAVFSNTAVYSPLAYAPQTITLLLGRMLRLPPLMLLYCGRLGSVLAWTSLGYLSLRLTPVLRGAFLLLLLMPMPLFLSAVLSADVMTSALAILLVAFCLHEATAAGPMRLSALLALLILTVCLSLTKLAYLPLLLLFFLIPARRLGSAWRYWLFFAATVLVNVIAVRAWLGMTPGLGMTLRPQDHALAPVQQLAWVEHHPLDFLNLYWHTIRAKAVWWMVALVGALGWLDTHLPRAFLIGYLLAIVLSAVFGRSSAKAIWLFRSRWALLALLAAIVFPMGAIGLMDYVTWTDLGAPRVEGIQGRYFMPLVPVALLLAPQWGPWLDRTWPSLRRSRWARLTPVAIAAISCLTTILVIYRRYYVKSFALL